MRNVACVILVSVLSACSGATIDGVDSKLACTDCDAPDAGTAAEASVVGVSPVRTPDAATSEPTPDASEPVADAGHADPVDAAAASCDKCTANLLTCLDTCGQTGGGNMCATECRALCQSCETSACSATTCN